VKAFVILVGRLDDLLFHSRLPLIILKEARKGLIFLFAAKTFDIVRAAMSTLDSNHALKSAGAAPHAKSNSRILGFVGRLDARRHGFVHLRAGAGAVLRDLLPHSGIAATKANVGRYGGLLFALF